MKLLQRSLKNYNCLNCSLKTRMISFLNFHLLKGGFMYLWFSSAVAQLLSFLYADCVFRYLVTLHERFIYLEIKLLPKRK